MPPPHDHQIPEHHLPSLLAALRRWWPAVGAVLIVAALIGLAMADRTSTPTVELRIGIDAVSAAPPGDTSPIDPRRLTAEVAAALKSPVVITKAEETGGLRDVVVATSFDEINAVVTARVSAETMPAATRAAELLVDAYNETRAVTARRTLAGQLAPIDAALERLRDTQRTVAAELRAITTNANASSTATGALAELNTRYASIVAQVAAYEGERDVVLRNAAVQDFTVYRASAPEAVVSRQSLALRYVPAALVVAIVLSLVGAGALARRRPWLSSPAHAGELLDAPVLALVPRGRARDEALRAAGRVGALAIEKTLTPAGLGMAVVMPVAAPGARARWRTEAAARGLGRELGRALDARGIKAVIAEVSADGATLTHLDGREFERRRRRERLTTAQLASWLRPTDLDVDVVLAVPARSSDTDICFDLLSASEATFVTASLGCRLDDLAALRRDGDAIGRAPAGVVVLR